MAEEALMIGHGQGKCDDSVETLGESIGVN
jgi:hypothetical protein